MIVDTTVLTRPVTSRVAIVLMSAVALLLMAWPLFSGVVMGAGDSLMWTALLGVPILVVVSSLVLDRTMSSAVVLALVGVMVALAAAARALSLGMGGVELIFTVVILAGRILGARLGFLVGVLAVAASSLVFGGFGPWTAFQMFAIGWVAAGAGLLPSVSPMKRYGHAREVALLAIYGACASYAFGLVMNLWFWPIAVGEGTTLSMVEGAGFLENASSFLVYSAITSTLTWDTVRAITTVVGIAVIGKPTLAALRRAYVRPA